MNLKKNSNASSKVIIIAGPTAVGKTALTIKLAKELDTEIVSADSMQIYKGLNMDILKSAMVIKLLEYLNLISIKYFKDDDIFSDIKITINNSSKLNLEDYKIYNILNEC